MTCNPLRRDSTWRMFQPGCWIDPDGHPHIFPDEIVAYLQIAHPEVHFTDADCEMISATFASIMRDQYPGVEIRFVVHERERAS